MGVRNRTLGPTSITGQTQVGTGSVLNRTQTSYLKVMDDVTGPKPYADHALLIEEYKYPIGLMNGSTGTPGTSGWRLAVNAAIPQAVPAHLGLPALAGVNSIATTCAARTNPSRPHVQLPVSLFELRELPKLIKQTGELLRDGHNIIVKHARPSSPGKQGSSAYLSWQFGWKPILSDLSKLVDFTSIADKRFKELQTLFDKGGITRRYQYQTDTVESRTSGLIETGLTLINGVTCRTTTRKVWGTVRWKANPGLYPKSSEHLRSYARTLILGCDNSQLAAELWEAMPWSWLIDWFTDIGDYLQASNNSLAHLAGSPNIMTHTKTTITVQPTNPPIWVGLPGSFSGYRETKQRQLGVISPISATLPVFTNRQLSILGALNVLKMRR